MSQNLLIESYAKRLRLPAIKRHYASIINDAIEREISYEDFLIACFEQDVILRDSNQIAHRIKQAKFPQLKTLETYEFDAIPTLNKQKIWQMSRSEYIEKGENILFIGNSGTGKTHLSIALGHHACQQGYTVHFWTAARLSNELMEAQNERRLLTLEKQWLKTDLIILDEVGYVPLSKTGAELLFQFIASRYERKSTILTSNLEFAH